MFTPNRRKTEKKGPYVARKRLHPLIERRRSLVKELALKKHVVEGKWYPTYPSAGDIAIELKRRYNVDASSRTVQQDCSKLRLKSYVRKHDPTRDPKHRKLKVAFAKRMLAMSSRWLSMIVFSDEHTMSLNDHTSRRMYAKSRAGVLPRERKRLNNTARFMIWGAIGKNYKSKLIIVDVKPDEDGRKRNTMTGDWYKRHCIQPHLQELLDRKLRFQQDGARPHIKKNVLKYMKVKGLLRLLGWPAYSPDFSPIETLWALINRRVSKLHPTDDASLRAATKKVWDELTPAECTKYQLSFANLLRKYLKLPLVKTQKAKRT